MKPRTHKLALPPHAAPQRKLKVLRRKPRIEPAKQQVQVQDKSWNRPAYGQEKCVLVYPGEHTVFSVREFNSLESLARFVAASSLKPIEYAIILGTVKRCDPRYKTSSMTRHPWDDGEIELANADEVFTSTAAMTKEDAYALLGGPSRA